MISDEARALGKAAKEAGQAWEWEAARWLRDNGWPDAHRLTVGAGRGARGDLIGVGPRLVDCKNRPWERTSEGLLHAAEHAELSGFGEFFIWKRIKGRGPGRSAMVGRAEVVWPLLAELDELRREARR